MAKKAQTGPMVGIHMDRKPVDEIVDIPEMPVTFIPGQQLSIGSMADLDKDGDGLKHYIVVNIGVDIDENSKPTSIMVALAPDPMYHDLDRITSKDMVALVFPAGGSIIPNTPFKSAKTV